MYTCLLVGLAVSWVRCGVHELGLLTVLLVDLGCVGVMSVMSVVDRIDLVFVEELMLFRIPAIAIVGGCCCGGG